MSAQALIQDSVVCSQEILPSDDLILATDALMFNTVCSITDPLTLDEISCIHAARYHLASGGHKVRAQLSIAAGLSLGMAKSDIIIIAAVSELLHNASLIHDDIQDGDDTRRGHETVWKKFGINMAICTGDLLLSAAYGVVANFSQVELIPKLISMIHQRTAKVIHGQSCDILCKLKPINNITEYEKITIAKSGALLSLPLELALIGSHHSQELHLARQAAEHFAIGYQIADDLCDIAKDAACASNSESMNIIFVLKASEEKQDLKLVAKKLALKNLEQSIVLAHKLPNSSGAALLGLAQSLKIKLAIV